MSRQFVPPGYVSSLQVIEAVANHLFPQIDEETTQRETEPKPQPPSTDTRPDSDPFAAVVKDGLKSPPRAAPLFSAYKPQAEVLTAEEEKQIFEVLHRLRSMLYAEKLSAFYPSPFGGGLTTIPSSFWLSDDADRTLASGRYWPFGTNQTYRDDKPSGQIFFKEGAIEAALSATSDQEASIASPAIPRLSNAGAKPKFDWPAFEEAFLAEVQARGVPSELNEKGWQSQADVVRFLQELAQRDGLDLPDSTAKPYAKKYLEKAKIDGN